MTRTKHEKKALKVLRAALKETSREGEDGNMQRDLVAARMILEHERSRRCV